MILITAPVITILDNVIPNEQHMNPSEPLLLAHIGKDNSDFYTIQTTPGIL